MNAWLKQFLIDQALDIGRLLIFYLGVAGASALAFFVYVLSTTGYQELAWVIVGAAGAGAILWFKRQRDVPARPA